jgi:hypothetical protein
VKESPKPKVKQYNFDEFIQEPPSPTAVASQPAPIIPQIAVVVPVIMKKPSILIESDDLPKEKRLLHKTVNEIVNTERDYVDDLETIIEV